MEVNYQNKSVCICSDSTNVVEEMKHHYDNRFWQDLKIHFIHIPRKFNSDADRLAKVEAARHTLIGGWL